MEKNQYCLSIKTTNLSKHNYCQQYEAFRICYVLSRSKSKINKVSNKISETPDGLSDYIQ
jgi:hypothetical protein